jgi:hypothetical protein
MALKKTLFILLVISINGCAASSPRVHGVDEEKVRLFASIYRKAKEGHGADMPSDHAVRLLPDAGYDAPYFPVYENGRVEKVWVPAHVAREDKDVLVAGHWVFVMVESPHWYIESPSEKRIAVPVILPVLPVKE